MVDARIPEIKRSAEARRRFLAEEDYRAACDERAKLKREERSALHQQAVENHINNEEYLASSSSSEDDDTEAMEKRLRYEEELNTLLAARNKRWQLSSIVPDLTNGDPTPFELERIRELRATLTRKQFKALRKAQFMLQT